MSSSAHIDNQKEDILVLDGVCYRVRTYANCRKKCIQLILLLQRKHFCLSLVAMGQIVTYLLIVQKFTNLKQKNLKF